MAIAVPARHRSSGTERSFYGLFGASTSYWRPKNRRLQPRSVKPVSKCNGIFQIAYHEILLIARAELLKDTRIRTIPRLSLWEIFPNSLQDFPDPK
jgi:hypothetical protein